MKILICLLLVSLVIARPAEDALDIKDRNSDGSYDIENLRHKRPVYNYYQKPCKYRNCPGYEVNGPFGPGGILNQGQGANENGFGSITSVGQIIGVNNGYVHGPSQYNYCKYGRTSKCKERYPIVQFGPGIVLNPDQVYNNGMNSPVYTQENYGSGSGGNSVTNQGSSPGSGYGEGSFGNVGIAPGYGNSGGGTGSPGSGTGQIGSSGSAQGTGSYCKRCPVNQQATKFHNLDSLEATNDADQLGKGGFATPSKDDSEFSNSIKETVASGLNVDTKINKGNTLVEIHQ